MTARQLKSDALQWSSVTGIVCPSGWDARGNVIDVTLSGEGEKDFCFTEDGRKRELIALAGRKVTVRGPVSCRARHTLIQVMQCDVVL